MTNKLFPLADSGKKIKDNIHADPNRAKTVDNYQLGGGESLWQILKNSSITVGFLIIALICVGLLGRLAYLQIIKGDDYLALAEGNRIRIIGTPATRGAILDKDGQVLANNVASFSLIMTPADLEDSLEQLKKTAEKVSQILEIDSQEIFTKLTLADKHSYQPKILLENISYKKALKLMTVSSDIPGLSVLTESRREYPQTEAVAHLLGYTGRLSEYDLELVSLDDYLLTDWIGKNGLEKYYEIELKGVNGKKQVEVNSLGKVQEILATEDEILGKNIYLTLDLDLQKYAYQQLVEAIDNTSAIAGSIIALNPNDGGVLALVDYPSYDNNKFIMGFSSEEYQFLLNDSLKPFFQRAISGEYPSGSTIKPLIGAAALAEGVVTPQTSFVSSGGIRIGEWFFPDWKAGGHGSTNIIKALAESVNTYFYLIGGGSEKNNYTDGLGVDKINEYGKKFRLSTKLGIDLPGEAEGFLPTPEWKKEVKDERWYIGDTYHLAIGQGDLLVTPLQIASLYSYFANGGSLYQPHLLGGLQDPQTNEFQNYGPNILEQDIVSSSVTKIIRQGLRETVLSGSARSLQSLSVTTAAKTGTAQFGNDNKSHAWFVTFAPYDSSEIVLVIFLEEGGEGSTTALPIAKNILNWYFAEK